MRPAISRRDPTRPSGKTSRRSPSCRLARRLAADAGLGHARHAPSQLIRASRIADTEVAAPLRGDAFFGSPDADGLQGSLRETAGRARLVAVLRRSVDVRWRHPCAGRTPRHAASRDTAVRVSRRQRTAFNDPASARDERRRPSRLRQRVSLRVGAILFPICRSHPMASGTWKLSSVPVMSGRGSFLPSLSM